MRDKMKRKSGSNDEETVIVDTDVLDEQITLAQLEDGIITPETAAARFLAEVSDDSEDAKEMSRHYARVASEAYAECPECSDDDTVVVEENDVVAALDDVLNRRRR